MGQAHARNFPAQAQQCKILDTSLPHALVVHLEARGAIGLSSALVIRDENNRIIVRGALPKAFQGMCSFGIGGEIEKIWIMKPDEIAAMAKEGRK
jgi:hypothetical protein